MFSERLSQLLDDILAGRAPNAGRFCGNCYHPLAPGRTACPHCGLTVSGRPPVEALPRALIEMHKVRRSRERLVVWAVAWGGLGIGVCVALIPIAFAGIELWSILAFFGLLGFFYLASANAANSLGDAWGYRWGQSIVRKRWRRLLSERDRED
ncbi:MAG: hypothetical protein E6J42_08715 [Chloroflexi bacterium]|nr:MAG: hypothetical protein E6J42_08715 [Chloroflexota bacterium]